MHVADLMHTNLETISTSDTIASAIAVLADSHVSGLPVLDEAGRFVGVLTASDILQGVAERDDPKSREQLFEDTLVGDLMTPRTETIAPDATIREAAQRLLYLEMHRLFVEHEGKLVGVISTSDLIRALTAART